MDLDKLPNLKEGEIFESLLEVMSRLRGPDGCPWDKKQTHTSLSGCLLEETYEVLESISEKDPRALREELGDLFLQVIFHSQIAKENQEFQIGELIRELIEKLVRRHPHVFADESVLHAEEATHRWEKIKASERPVDKSLLGGVPKELPALLRAYRMGSKASRVGFDWPNLEGVLDKVDEELKELHEEVKNKDLKGIEEELGDFFFSLAQMARFLSVNPEEALRKSTNKFQRRFEWMEKKLREDGKNLFESTPEELNSLWEQSKELRL